MKKLWNMIGHIAFWLAWPALFVYLRLTHRTRVIIEYNNKVLVVKGWLGGGKWSLPGGGQKHGETTLRAACREVLEETSINLHPKELKSLGEFEQRQNGLKFTYELFGARLDQQQNAKRQRGEITEVAWIPISDIKSANAEENVLEALKVWSEN